MILKGVCGERAIVLQYNSGDAMANYLTYEYSTEKFFHESYYSASYEVQNLIYNTEEEHFQNSLLYKVIGDLSFEMYCNILRALIENKDRTKQEFFEIEIADDL